MPHRTDPSSRRVEVARKLRRDATFPERILWSLLRDRRLNGHKFRRQQPVGAYVVDYLCEEAKLVVELDGMSHIGQAQQDEARESYLRRCGLRIVRVTNDDVLKDRHVVAQWILDVIEGSDPTV